MATTISTDSPKVTANIADHADVFGGRALVFDGVVDRLSTPNITTSATSTYSFWINLNSVSGTQDLFTHANIYFRAIDNELYVYSDFPNHTRYDNVLVTGSWNHIAWVANGSTHKVYINGEELTPNATTSSAIAVATNVINIGSSGNPFSASMADFKYYHSALSESDIRSQYLKPESVPSPSTLLAWYPMIEGNPESPQSIVYDHSEKKLGSDVVVNGSFDTDSNWSKGTGWTISDGKARCDGTQTGNTNLQTSVAPLTSGKLYKVTFDLTRSAGNFRFLIGSSGSSDYYTTDGTHTFYKVENGNDHVYAQGDSNFVGTLNNVIIKEVLMGNHATTNFFGSELNPNPTFSNFTGNVPDGWGVVGDDDSGNNISQGSAGGLRLQSDGGSIFAHLADVNVVGKTYQFSITITNVNDDDFSFKTLNTKFFNGDGKSAGTYTGTYVAEATYVRIFRDDSCDVEITAFSLKEVGISSSGFETSINEPVVPQVPLMKYNQKMLFNEDDGYVDISGIGDVTGAFSWSIWINDIGNATQGYILGRTSGNDYLRLFGGRITVRIAGSSDQSFTQSGQYTHSDIRHIAVTRSSSNNLKLYVNGIEGVLYNGSSYVTGGVTNSGTSNIDYIGRETGVNNYRGLINEFSIFNTELTQTQVQELFNDGVALDAITHSQSANLIGYWRNDGVTTWKDRSTNSNDGDVQGTPDSITIREGLNANRDALGFYFTNPSSNVLRLNGGNDFVTIDSTGSLPSGDQSRSITCWIKPSSLSGDQPIIFTGTYSSNQMFTLAFLSANPTKISVWGYSNDNTGTDVLTTDNWWYVGVTYDSGTNTLKSYIGGGANNINPALDINNTSTTNYNTTYGDVRIGRASTQDKYFDGIVDEVKIYNRALSTDEILKDFKHQKGKHKND